MWSHLLVAKAPRPYKNVTEIIYAGAKVAIKSARRAINFAESFSRLDVSATSKAKSICEEFCEKVSCLYKYNIPDPSLSSWEGEIKCTMDTQYFTELNRRMVEVRYCCTQVQSDKENKKCIAWFEPMSLYS